MVHLRQQRPSEVMGAGDKRKRGGENGARQGSVAAVKPRDLTVSARFSELINLRETRPEKLLREYVQESGREVQELRALCEAQKRAILLLNEKLKSQSATPDNGESVAEKPALMRGKTGDTHRGRRHGTVPDYPSGVSPKPTEKSVRPSVEDENRMLRILSGIVPEKMSVDADGVPCFEYSVRNPTGDKSVRFTLSRLKEESSDIDGVLSYEPIEVKLPGMNAVNPIFMDGLDFDAKHASALLRDILSHVLETDTQQAMPSAKKSGRKRRQSMA